MTQITRLRVRAHECDSLGHVNNAVYLQYLQEATLDLLGDHEGDATPRNGRTVSVEYHAPARPGDALRIATWVVAGHDSGLTCLYRISHESDGGDVATARISWSVSGPSNPGCVHTASRSLLCASADEMPVTPRPFIAPPDNGARPFIWRTRVRRYELGLNGSVGLATYFNWLEEATFRAAEVVSWPLKRMRNADLVIVQHRHDAEVVGSLSAGDEVEVASRLLAVRRVRGTWEHLVRRLADGALVLRDYSTGAFLTNHGSVRTLPPELVTALQAGETASAADEE